MPDPYALVLGQSARKISELDRHLREQEVIENGYSMGDVIGTIWGFPGLRAFWPFSSRNESFQAIDGAGQGRTLALGGTVFYGTHNNILPYVNFTGGGASYLYRADEAGLDITTDLTVGAWVRYAALGSTGVIAKHDGATAAGSAYLLDYGVTAANRPGFQVASGASFYPVSGSAALATGTWHFLSGRYTPSTEVALFVNNTKFTFTTAIPASLNNSGAQFEVGGINGAFFLHNGDIAIPFLCAASLPDVLINRYFNISRTLFGV